MSIVFCERCDRDVDSDDDPCCYCGNPYDSKDVTVKDEHPLLPQVRKLARKPGTPERVPSRKLEGGSATKESAR